MRCDGPGCSVTAHLHCYFTPGSQDAEDVITDIENWHCEGCGGLPRHLHPRPPAMKQARVSFCSALTAPFDVRLGQGGSASERPGAGWGARGGGEHHAARTGTGSGKGKEPMDVDDADTWMGHADMMTHESALGNTMKTAQTQQLQAADEDEEMGLNLFDSRALTAEYVGTPGGQKPSQAPQEDATIANPGLTLDRANKDLEHTRAPEPALGPHSTRPPRRKSLWAQTGHTHDHRRNYKGQGRD